MKKEDLLKLLPSIHDRILNNNESITMISKEYTISRNRLSKMLKEIYNYESPSAKYSKLAGKKDYDKLDKKAYDRIIAGEKLTSVAKDLGLKRHSLSKRLKRKYNLEILADGKNKINSNFFNTLNRASAYWLGFIYADGYIYNNSLGISSKDYDIIERFKNDIESDHKISQKQIKGINYYSLKANDKKIVDDLISLGISYRKSFNEMTFPVVSDDLFSDFLRGFIDGDGCYFEYKHRFIVKISIGHSNEKFANDLIDRIKRLYDIDFKIYKGNTIYSVDLYRKEDTIKLVNILYKDTDLFLNRKYEIIKRFLLPS